MPSQKFARAPLWCAVSVAFGLAVASPYADAAGLGRLTVQSGLGQPLKAELEVTAVGRDEMPTLQVKLAPPAAFRAANLEFNPALSNLRFALEKRADGNYFVRINSPQPVNEPYLDLMVELTWATGRVIREYTVLLDPPSLRQQAEVVAPVAPPAPVAAPAPARPGSRRVGAVDRARGCRRLRRHRPLGPRRPRRKAATRSSPATRWAGSPRRTGPPACRSTRCWSRCSARTRRRLPEAT